MHAAIWVALLCAVAVMLVSGLEPDTAWSWAIIGAPLVLLTAWFVWANRQAMTRPELQLARTQPVVAGPLTREGSRKKALSQITYGQLSMAAIAGIVMVPLAADHVDVWAGWGRLVWLIPTAFVALAITQAFRKYRSESGIR